MVAEPEQTQASDTDLAAGSEHHDGPPDQPWVVALTLGLLGSFTLLLHAPAYLLTTPFWLDEAWVAVASKAPLDKLLWVTSSTPLGWTLVMLGIPGGGEQRYRLLTLAFAIGSVMVAFFVARDLTWPSRTCAYVAGLTAALAAAVVPVALLRNDLKQFTGDAFFALLLVWLLIRLEQRWSRQRLGALVAVSILSSFVSTASLFVTAALFASLVVVTLVGRTRARIIEVAAATAVAGLGTLTIAALFVLPNANENLSGYWVDWFLSTGDGVFELVRVVWQRFADLAPLMGSAWPPILAGLIIVGIVSIALRGRPAAALAIPVLWAEMLALGVLDRYPFLDQRTSHFLLVLTIVVAAIGVVDIAVRLAKFRQILGLAFLIGAIAVYAVGVSDYVGRPTIPREDVRSQVRHIEDTFIEGDVIVVSVGGTFGFPYYWSLDDPVFFKTKQWPTGFGVGYDTDSIIFASNRSSGAINDAVGRAIDQATEARSTGRIWVVRTHINRAESEAWTRVLDERRLVVEQIDTGIEPLILIENTGESR